MALVEGTSDQSTDSTPKSSGTVRQRAKFQRLAERAEWRSSRDRKIAISTTITVAIFGEVVIQYWAYRLESKADANLTFADFFFASDFKSLQLGPAIGNVIVAFFAAFAYMHFRGAHNERFLLGIAEDSLAAAEQEASASGGLTLANLWTVNQQRLDYYHGIATAHARQSFRNAQLAMGVGLIGLVLAAFAAASAKSTTAAIITGALGAIGASLSAYVGSTFVRTQENSSRQLQSYFLQPLEFSRLLAAERLLGQASNDARDAIIAELTRSISFSAASPSSAGTDDVRIAPSLSNGPVISPSLASGSGADPNGT